MVILNWLTAFGKYIMMLKRVFRRPDKMRMFLKSLQSTL